MSSLSDKAGILIIANLIKYAVGFMMPIVLVRMLDQDSYGSYQQLLLVGTTMAGIMTLGLPASIYYFYHHGPASKRSALIFQTVVMLAMAGLVSGALVHLAAPFLARHMNNPNLTGLLGTYALYIGLSIAGEHFIHFLISQDRYRLAVGFETGETLIRVVMLLLPLWMGYGLVGLVWVAVIYAGLRFLVRTGMILKGVNWFTSQWRGSLFFREQFGYSLPLFLTSLVGFLGNLLDKAIIAAFFNPAHYAIYSVGALEIPLDVIFQASVANVLRASLPPLIREGNMAEVIRLWREAVRKLAIIVLPSFVFLFGFSHDFITLLFTNRYTESVYIFRIYLCMLPLYMFVFSVIPQVFGKTKLNFYIAVTGVTAHIILSFALLKVIGFYGPAIAAVIISFLSAGAYFIVAMRLAQTSAGQLLPLVTLGKIVSAAFLSLGAAYLLRGVVDIRWVDFVICAATYSVSYLALSLLLGVFTAADRKLLWRWIAKVLPRYPR
ncbi:MAG: lipopolysaccharide biosynthesis protein [Sulfuricaulis sp.]